MGISAQRTAPQGRLFGVFPLRLSVRNVSIRAFSECFNFGCLSLPCLDFCLTCLDRVYAAPKKLTIVLSLLPGLCQRYGVDWTKPHLTGSAIKGAQRADIFFGTGDEAGRLAGQIKDAGRLVQLVPIQRAYAMATGDDE